MACIFCQIAAGEVAADVVYRDADCCVFLDATPLFPGHLLLIPRQHIQTLPELPPDRVGPLFQVSQRLARAVVDVLGAQGSFIAVNNIVSQSVSHLHIHVVPRRKGDGLKGFFWPRRPYTSEAEKADVVRRLQAALSAPVPAA